MANNSCKLLMRLFGLNGAQLLVILISFLVCVIVIERIQIHEKVTTYSEMIELLEQFINEPREVRSAQLELDIHQNLKRMWKDRNLRFTLIRGDGVVLIDGAVDHRQMPNQLVQIEIQQALVNGHGYAVRDALVTDGKMMYVAKPIETPWGTLYGRLGTEPDYIHTNKLVWILPIIVMLCGYFLVKLI